MYKKQHIHFVGVGGIGMSGLAQVLLHLGYRVSGSDLRETTLTAALARMGGVIYKGHAEAHIEGADVVVTSSAVREDNPEVTAAKAAQIPVIPRAEMLAELMRLKKFGIAVAGAHGKTSTTSMISGLLHQAGLDPTVIIGGEVRSLKSNAYWGKGDFLVAEADESDGSFLRLTPSIAVVTNIDLEHLDHYPDIEAIRDAFAAFIDKIPFYGVAILCADDPHLRLLLPQISKRTVTYGLSEEASLRAENVEFHGLGSSFDVSWQGHRLGSIELNVPGMHHILNSLAAVAVGLELGVTFGVIREGLMAYKGVGRRFEIMGEADGITVVDDYAHHPTEIRATLAGARACWPDKRLVVLFEPHRYTRTQALMKNFSTAFEKADELWLTEIYAASEQPILGITGERLCRNIHEPKPDSVHFVERCEDLPKAVAPGLRSGDVVLTLGAGTIGRIGPALLDLLGSKESAIAG